MAAPIVSWYDASNTTQQTSWDIGTVDAGSVSADAQFLIWNNRGGTTDVSDMTNCTITTKDSSGGDTGELVTGKWVEVKVDELGESSFTPIGGTTTHPIGNGITAGTIAGTANDGTLENADANNCLLTVHANVPATATAGNYQFLLRVSYQYV